MKHTQKTKPLVLGLALLLGACATSNRTRTDLPAGSVPDAGTTSSAPVLYARDGSVVAPGGPGTVQAQSGPASGAVPQEGSRTYLLELYQKAIDEKEALALEVKSLAATLEKSRTELALAKTEQTSLQKQVTTLETERARLQEESFELAGRLVTAQIRRLEAEKILLESKIEWQRLEEKTAADKARPASALKSAAAKSESAHSTETTDRPASAEHKP